MDALVRPLRPDEWRELRALRLRALRDAPLSFFHSYDEDAALPDEHWVAWASRPGTYVAERDGAWVGMVVTHVVDGEFSRGGMWIAPAARGRGLGRPLVEAALAGAREQGHDDIALWVNEDNRAALRLYESCGFRRSGVDAPQRWRPELRVLRLTQRL